MTAASFGSSKLDHLRSEARSKGLKWLRSEMDNTKRDEVRQLAQAAGSRVRREDKAWLSAGELRETLVEHLAPSRSAPAAGSSGSLQAELSEAFWC